MDALTGMRGSGRGAAAAAAAAVGHPHRRGAVARAAVTAAVTVVAVAVAASAVAPTGAAGQVSGPQRLLTAEFLEWASTRPALSAAVDAFIDALPTRELPLAAGGGDGGGGLGAVGGSGGSGIGGGVRLPGTAAHPTVSDVPPVTASGVGDLNADGTGDRLWGDGARNALEVGYSPPNQSSGVVYTTVVDTSPLSLAAGDAFGSALASMPGPLAFVGAHKAGGGDGALHLLALARVPAGEDASPAAYPTYAIAQQGLLRPGEGDWGGALPSGTGFGASLSVMDDAVVGDDAAELDILVGDMDGNVFGVAIGDGMTAVRVVPIRRAPSSTSPEAGASPAASPDASPSAAPEAAAPATAAPETAAPTPAPVAPSPTATATTTPVRTAAPTAGPSSTATPPVSPSPTATAAPSAAPAPEATPAGSSSPPPSPTPSEAEGTPTAAPPARPACLYTPSHCDCAPVSAVSTPAAAGRCLTPTVLGSPDGPTPRLCRRRSCAGGWTCYCPDGSGSPETGVCEVTRERRRIYVASSQQGQGGGSGRRRLLGQGEEDTVSCVATYKMVTVVHPPK